MFILLNKTWRSVFTFWSSLTLSKVTQKQHIFKVHTCCSMYAFLLPNNIPLYGSITYLSIHPFVILLAIMSNATMNIYVLVFISFGFIPRLGIGGSYGNSMLNLLRNCQAVFLLAFRFVCHSWFLSCFSSYLVPTGFPKYQ